MVMANGAGTQSRGEKKMQFKPVNYDVNEIAPDAPAGHWTKVSIPRGKIKIRATDDGFPQLIIPCRLDKTDEEDEKFQSALGTELATFVTFYDNSQGGFAARQSKLTLRDLCDAADVDLDTIPKKIEDEGDLADLINALEGKSFEAWTTHRTNKGTGEVRVNLQFHDPKGTLSAKKDDGDEEESEEERPAKKTSKRR